MDQLCLTDGTKPMGFWEVPSAQALVWTPYVIPKWKTQHGAQERALPQEVVPGHCDRIWERD